MENLLEYLSRSGNVKLNDNSEKNFLVIQYKRDNDYGAIIYVQAKCISKFTDGEFDGADLDRIVKYSELREPLYVDFYQSKEYNMGKLTYRHISLDNRNYDFKNACTLSQLSEVIKKYKPCKYIWFNNLTKDNFFKYDDGELIIKKSIGNI